MGKQSVVVIWWDYKYDKVLSHLDIHSKIKNPTHTPGCVIVVDIERADGS